jgi:hypothetical protein
MSSVLLLQLLLAHVLTDFVFQSKKRVGQKKEKGLRSGFFWYHIALSGILTYVILMDWQQWAVPVFIAVAHGIIDLWKIRMERKLDLLNKEIHDEKDKKTGITYFFIDQILHIIVILVAWLFLTKGFGHLMQGIVEFLSDIKSLAILIAFLIIIWPAGIVIGKITESFRRELSHDDSLARAGTYIGISERILVLVFVLLGQYAAIGFLIAAKSILRVAREGDLDARKKTEYVLIGTLISFSVAVVIGLLTKYIIAG